MYPNFILLLLINCHNQVLLLRRINTPFCNNCYCLPGGTIQPHEPATRALIRESASSLGITIQPADIDCVHIMHRKCNEPEFFACVFKPRTWQGTPTIMEPNRYADLQWFALDALPTNMVPAHKHAIEQILAGNTYSEHGWDH